MIKIKNISKSFDDLKVINDISFEIEKKEIVCILGPSGCGKSTLLNIIAGLNKDYLGTIENNVGKISYVFQEDRLLEWKTVYENIQFVNRNSEKKDILKLIKEIGLEDFENSYPRELSGGMRQRCSIARAFNFKAPLLIMDEPFKSLDYTLSLQMIKKLIKVWEERENSILMVTHNIDQALLLGNKLLVLSKKPTILLEEIKIHIPQDKRKLTDKFLIDTRNRIIDLLI
ncbi:ABC transporter ATP-binding protein [Fusobacterium sp. IOR10]|uniref:ABC transporter ATP-binding protein n=1 Tax=Fusobacterium sp. IOR10 TaxID=2665157 RepID=UPI00193F342B|nr:ABC transporter ATP-binding protein [Fusobacterium sp. IOR10]